MLAGLDWTAGSLLMGISVTQSQGESDYTVQGAGGSREQGTLTASLTGAAPYLHWLSDEGLGIWGSAGTGSGDLEVKTRNGVTETGIGMTIMAAGAKKSLTGMGYDKLAVKGDVFVAQTSAEETEGFDELEAGATRMRLALERNSQRETSGGGSRSSHLELGARLDSGDDAEGAGADAAGEIRYASPSRGFEVAGRAGMLLLHGQSGFSEWSAGLEASYSPGRGGRGLQVSLEPRWNIPRAGVAESLWSGATPDAIMNEASASDSGASTVASVGYGAAVLRGSLLTTPYSEAETGSGTVRLRLGVKLTNEGDKAGRFQLDLYGERREHGFEDIERRALIEGRLGF